MAIFLHNMIFVIFIWRVYFTPSFLLLLLNINLLNHIFITFIAVFHNMYLRISTIVLNEIINFICKYILYCKLVIFIIIIPSLYYFFSFYKTQLKGSIYPGYKITKGFQVISPYCQILNSNNHG